MKILLIHRYFWPDQPPYALMLRRIAGQLAHDGHDVTVLSCQPSYKVNYTLPRQPWREEREGFQVHRIRMIDIKRRNIIIYMLNIMIFCVNIFLKILSNRYDIVMISTVPPVLGAVAVRWGAKLKGSKYIYHCMDLHPEIMRLSGYINNKFLYRILEIIDTENVKNSSATIVLSQDMKNTLLARGIADNKVMVINNFELKDDSEAKPEDHASLLKDIGKFRVLFAGNIGRFQGVHDLVDATRHLEKYDDIELVFMGEGKALEGLKQRADHLGGESVRFIEHQPVSVARLVIADADLCVVALQKDVYRFAFPSKIMTYLCEGAPVLALVEDKSELAQMVRSFKFGFIARQGDPESIASAIIKAYRSKSNSSKLNDSAKSLGLSTYSEQSVLPKWVALFRRLQPCN